jgi:SapC
VTEGMNGAAAPAVADVQRMVLLDRVQHAGKRVQAVSDWRFAIETNALPITGVEFAEIARECPIGFINVGTDDKGQALIAPMALLGLRERQNLFIDATTGRWLGGYLPATLRRYPFAFVRNQGSDQLSLAIDEGYPGFNDSEGELLLAADGTPTEYVQSVMRFLERFEVEQQRTAAFCARLVELNLLRGAEIKGDLANGEKINAAGFFMVDEQKLQALPDADVLSLHRAGILGLIHAHLVSMGQVHRLATRIGGL